MDDRLLLVPNLVKVVLVRNYVQTKGNLYYTALFFLHLAQDYVGRGDNIEVVRIEVCVCHFNSLMAATVALRELVERVHVVFSLHNCDLPVVLVGLAGALARALVVSLVHHVRHHLACIYTTAG